MGEGRCPGGRLTPSSLNAQSWGWGSLRLAEMHTVSLILKLNFILAVEFY